VATPLLAPDGGLIAAITAAVDASESDRLDHIGDELKKAVTTIGRQHGLKAKQPVEQPAWNSDQPSWHGSRMEQARKESNAIRLHATM